MIPSNRALTTLVFLMALLPTALRAQNCGCDINLSNLSSTSVNIIEVCGGVIVECGIFCCCLSVNANNCRCVIDVFNGQVALGNITQGELDIVTS